VRPLPTPEELHAHHERCYEDGVYATFAAADDIRKIVAQQRLATIVSDAPEGPWLEIGSGTGAFLEAARERGITAEGIDLSAMAVARARERGLVVHHADVGEFIPERLYTAVVAFDVLEHLSDPRSFVRRVASWLRPGGLLALATPDASSLVARVMGRHWFQYWPPDHLNYFTPETARRLLDLAGFSGVQAEPARKPLTLAYALNRLRDSHPRQGQIAAALATFVPRSWRTRPWIPPLGEMIVRAHRPNGPATA
jgi:SAM-dependent methyltransferase